MQKNEYEQQQKLCENIAHKKQRTLNVKMHYESDAMKDGWHGNEERIKSKREQQDEEKKKCKRNPKTRNLVCERWSHLYLCWSAASASYCSSSVWYHFGCVVVIFFTLSSINSSSMFYLSFVHVHWMQRATFFSFFSVALV